MEDLIDRLRKAGEETGRVLFRVIFYDDGRGEFEFSAKNAWESVVIPCENWKDLYGRIESDDSPAKLFQQAVIRKKCTKCFLHQRPLPPDEQA